MELKSEVHREKAEQLKNEIIAIKRDLQDTMLNDDNYDDYAKITSIMSRVFDYGYEMYAQGLNKGDEIHKERYIDK